jgi:hypothetical protein
MTYITRFTLPLLASASALSMTAASAERMQELSDFTTAKCTLTTIPLPRDWCGYGEIIPDAPTNFTDRADAGFAGQSILNAHHVGLKPGTAITVALRPEALSLRRHPGEDLSLPGRVLHSRFRDSVIRAQVDIAGRPVGVDVFNRDDVLVIQEVSP